jgi:prepilin-type N-terminal cleavage/methylation domain-containing protein
MHGSQRQDGFSLIELMIVMGIMLTLTALVMRFMNDSIMVSNVTNEMTEAQQNLRTAQEFISRDLMAAGDGMEDIKSPRLPKTFMDSYLSSSTVKDTNVLLGILGVLTSDDQVPSVAVPLATPAAKTLAGTDRLTIMQMDPSFNSGATIGLGAGAITNNGLNVTLPAGTLMTQFKTGDVYFFSSSKGSAFGCITAINPATRVLTLAASGQPLAGINKPDAAGPMNAVILGGSATMMRMFLINYFIDENKLLRRRVIGASGGFTDTVVAEHVADMQIRYVLGSSNANGTVKQPTTTLTNETDQGSVRQVEVTLTTETVHPIVNGNRQQITMMTGTAIRNLQFNKSLRPN